MDRELAVKYAILYKLLLDYFNYFGIKRLPELLLMIEMAVSRYAIWADAIIREQAIKEIEKSLRGTALKPEAVIPLLSYVNQDHLKTLGQDVAKHVGTGLKIAGAVNLLGIFRQRMGIGLVWTLRAAKTTAAHAGSDSALLGFQSQGISHWIWESALLETTCMACIAMHGTIHPVTERLNDHQSGFCRPKPLVAGLPMTGREWFYALKKEQQIAMMGPSKYEAWVNGQFDLRDLVTTYNDPTFGELVRESSLKGILGEGAKQWRKQAFSVTT